MPLFEADGLLAQTGNLTMRGHMSLKTQRTGQIGVNVVERIVLREWRARWQALDSVNDDGVDGLIFLEALGAYTGQVIHVQVKCLSDPFIRNNKGYYRVPVGKEKLARNVQVWRRTVGAAILVLVDPDTLEAFWVNLRNSDALAGAQVLVPALNRFDQSSRAVIRKLCGTLHSDQLLPVVETNACHFAYLRRNDHISVCARTFYKELHRQALTFVGSNEPIRFTREGWKHITRKKRPPLLRLQCFQILGAIVPMISQCKETDLCAYRTRTESSNELVYIQKFVRFTFRQSAAISIVFIKRSKDSSQPSFSFHTIYETRRNRDIMGIK